MEDSFTVSKVPKIITIGSATQDVFLLDHDDFTTRKLDGKTVFNRITLGSKIKIDHALMSTGGGGTNVAVTFARSGYDTIYVGSVGDDLAGNTVVEALEGDIIDTRYVRTRKNTGTGYSTILLAPNGERTVLAVKGASKTFAGIDFGKIISTEKPNWIYITTLAGDMKSLAKIVNSAKTNGVKVFFNPGDSEIDQIKELLPILKNIDIISVNEEEAERLLKKAKIRKTWKKYLNTGGKFGTKIGAIVSHGPKGAYFTTGEKLYFAGLYSNEKPIDRTGAGDSFGSGFLAEYIRTDGNIERALTFAGANSSSVVMFVGAKEGILPAGAKLKKMPIVVKNVK